MSEPTLTKEQRILRVMRKVLAQIVKDVTPTAERTNPLQESTIRDIRDLFGLIAEREAELARQAGLVEERPHFSDEPRKSKVLHFHRPPAGQQGDSGDGE